IRRRQSLDPWRGRRRGHRAEPAGAAAHGRGMAGGSRSRLHLTRPSSAAMKEFDARFFDGETAVAHRVRVQHDADALIIRDADGRELARWPIEGLRTVGDPGEDGAALLTCSGWSQARLVVDDEDVRIDLAAMVPRLKRLGRRRRTGAFSWAGLAIGAAAVIAALIGAVDRLPGWAAPLVPQSWQRPVGDQVIASLAAGHGFCDAAPGTTA